MTQPQPDEEYEDDLSECPYYARYNGLPGHDPSATCFQLGTCSAAEEPMCVTCEPIEGWPSRHEAVES
jgi:hypothetical protein